MPGRSGDFAAACAEWTRDHVWIPWGRVPVAGLYAGSVSEQKFGVLGRIPKTLLLAASLLLAMTLLNIAWAIHRAAQHANVTPGTPFVVVLIYTPFLLAVFLLRRSRVARFLTWLWALDGVFRAATLVLHAVQARTDTLPWIYWDVGLTLAAGALLATPSARSDVVKFHAARPARIRMVVSGRQGG